MPALDHIIVAVNDVAATIAFWTRYLGVIHVGSDGPFEVLRVDASTIIQLSGHGTAGHQHYAFQLDRPAFEAAFARLKADNIPFGDAFNTVGSDRGPGEERGALGLGPTVYFFDPNRHLLEIRASGDSSAEQE